MAKNNKSSQGFIGGFRSGIRFSERFGKNITIQLKWWWNSLLNKQRLIRTWRIRNNYHSSIEYGLKILISLFYLILIMPVIILWALLKSI